MKVNKTNLRMDNIVLYNDSATGFDDESVEELKTIRNKISDEE